MNNNLTEERLAEMIAHVDGLVDCNVSYGELSVALAELQQYRRKIDELTAVIDQRNGECVRLHGELQQYRKAESAERETLQAGNSPVIPDGYVMVPKEPTAEMIAAALECDDVVFDKTDDSIFCVQHDEIWRAMITAAQEVSGD